MKTIFCTTAAAFLFAAATSATATSINSFREGDPRSSTDMAPSDSNAQGDLGSDANLVQLANGAFIANDYFGTLGAGFYGFSGGLVIDCRSGPDGNDCEGDASDAFTFSIASGFEVTGVTFSSRFQLSDPREEFEIFGLRVSENLSGFTTDTLGNFAQLVDAEPMLELDVDPVLGQGGVPSSLSEGVYTFNPFLDAPLQGVGTGFAAVSWTVGVTVVDNNPPISSVPLPAGGLLMIAGFGALGVAARRKRA